MKHLSSSLLILLLSLVGLTTAINSPTASADSSTQKKPCYEIGKVYLKGSLPNEIRFIRLLESGRTFWTNKGSGDVGNHVLVSWDQNAKKLEFIRVLKPKWAGNLAEIQYKEKKKIEESGESFCPK